MTNKRFWPRNWPPPEGDDTPPAPRNPTVKSVQWTYDKPLMMWRRDINVRAIDTTRGWIAVHSLKGRLDPDFDTSDEAMAAADAAWPT